MRRSHLLFIAALALWGCSGVREAQVERGWIDRATLMAPEHHQFQERYDTVEVEQQFVPMIRSVADGVSTIVFLGTWCPDSRREVPHFLKVADEAGIPSESIRLYALDRGKRSDDGLTDQYHIQRVPTFIFLKGGKEIGRITEVPRTTMEQDMLIILANAGTK
jgi:thiol-disulfide isomerase/thioredoxin